MAELSRAIQISAKDFSKYLFISIFMSPVSPVFHAVVTVSWPQRLTKDDDFYSIGGQIVEWSKLSLRS